MKFWSQNFSPYWFSISSTAAVSSVLPHPNAAWLGESGITKEGAPLFRACSPVNRARSTHCCRMKLRDKVNPILDRKFTQLHYSTGGIGGWGSGRKYITTKITVHCAVSEWEAWAPKQTKTKLIAHASKPKNKFTNYTKFYMNRTRKIS